MTSGSFRLDGEEVQGLDDAALTSAPPQHAGLCVPVSPPAARVLGAGERHVAPPSWPKGRVSRAHRTMPAACLTPWPGPGHEQAPGRAVGHNAAARGHCARAGHEPAAGAGRSSPPGNLDTASSAEVFCLLRRIHAERGTSFVVVTHDPRLAARCDRLVELIDGRIARDEGPSPRVWSQHRTGDFGTAFAIELIAACALAKRRRGLILLK